MTFTELAFDGRGNQCRIPFLEDGAPFNSGPVTRTLLEWGNGQTLIDSADNPDAIGWENNDLVLSLGNAGIPPGAYEVRVIIFTDVYPEPEGLVIYSEYKDKPLVVRIVK